MDRSLKQTLQDIWRENKAKMIIIEGEARENWWKIEGNIGKLEENKRKSLEN